MEIQPPGTPRHRAPVEIGGERGRVGGVDRFAVGFQPVPEIAQHLDTAGRYLAETVRADVQQVIGVLGHDIGQQPRDLVGRAEIEIVLVESPVPVDRGTGLAVLGQRDRRHLVIAQRDVITPFLVTARAEPAVDDAVRLFPAHERQQPAGLIRGDLRRRVEPQLADRAVIAQQLVHLGKHLVVEESLEIFLFLVRVIPAVAGRVRMMPVHRLRVVHPEPHPLVGAGLRQFADDIPLERRRVDDVVG